MLMDVVFTGCELLNKQPITKQTVVCSPQLVNGEMESFCMLTAMKHTFQSHAQN
jgi:hypothetical protein